MKDYDKKSSVSWEKTWKKALQDKKCPIEGCDLSQKACKHLNSYLAYPSFHSQEVKLIYTEDIDRFGTDREAERAPSTKGTYAIYKKLKKQGFKNHDILLIIDRFYLKKTLRAILKERGWTSYGTLYRRVQKLHKQLKFVFRSKNEKKD